MKVLIQLLQLWMVFACYQRSNWFNIIDIQDYDGSGLIYVTQNAVIYYQNIGIAVACAIGMEYFTHWSSLVHFNFITRTLLGLSMIMMLLMMWLSSIFLVLSMAGISIASIVLVAVLWEQYDKVRETTILVAGCVSSILLVIWCLLLMRILKKIELIFMLYHLAATAMKKNLRMLIYAPCVSISGIN